MAKTYYTEGLINSNGDFNGIIIILREAHTDGNAGEGANPDYFWFKDMVNNKPDNKYVQYFEDLLEMLPGKSKRDLKNAAYFNLKNWGVGGATKSKEYNDLIKKYTREYREHSTEHCFETRLNAMLMVINGLNVNQNKVTILTVEEIYNLIKNYAKTHSVLHNNALGFYFQRGDKHKAYRKNSFAFSYNDTNNKAHEITIYHIYHPSSQRYGYYPAGFSSNE